MDTALKIDSRQVVKFVFWLSYRTHLFIFLKIINGGLRIFSRCSLKTGETEGCQFRLTQEVIIYRFTFLLLIAFEFNQNGSTV